MPQSSQVFNLPSYQPIKGALVLLLVNPGTAAVFHWYSSYLLYYFSPLKKLTLIVTGSDPFLPLGILLSPWVVVFGLISSPDASRSSTANEQADRGRKLDWDHFPGWAREEAGGTLLPRSHCCQHHEVGLLLIGPGETQGGTSLLDDFVVLVLEVLVWLRAHTKAVQIIRWHYCCGFQQFWKQDNPNKTIIFLDSSLRPLFEMLLSQHPGLLQLRMRWQEGRWKTDPAHEERFRKERGITDAVALKS